MSERSERWDLSADQITFPIVLEDGEHELYIHMKPYQARELKEMLKHTSMKMATKGKNLIEILNSDPDAAKGIFENNLIGVTGLGRKDGGDPTKEEVLAWLARNRRRGIDRAIVRGGFGGLAVEFEETAEDFSVDATFAQIRINGHQMLGFVNGNQKWEGVRVDVAHNLRPETDKDVKLYEESQGRSRVHTKEKTFERVVNYDLLEKCYAGLVDHLEGYSVGEFDCIENNRDQWIPLVPLWHKDVVLAAYFRGVTVKND